jgi:hypothetical protein
MKRDKIRVGLADKCVDLANKRANKKALRN